MKKILLDTDIGSDIDDCFTLGYLLCHPDVELVGITTCTGLPHLRAQLAHEVCETAGVHVPIHVGAEQPLSGELRQPVLTQAQTIVAERSSRKFSPQNTALEFMRETIENAPHEITLVAIGPLTNVGLLFETYPHIPSLLGGLVIMGGRYHLDPSFDTNRWGVSEWNILCDARAAEIVFAQTVPNTLAIGVEQTIRLCLKPAPIKEELYQIPRMRGVSDSVNTIAKEVHFHDTIALYALLHPEKVTLTRGDIALDLSDIQHRCATTFTPSENGQYEVVTDFSPSEFIKHYTEIVGLPLEKIV